MPFRTALTVIALLSLQEPAQAVPATTLVCNGAMWTRFLPNESYDSKVVLQNQSLQIDFSANTLRGPLGSFTITAMPPESITFERPWVINGEVVGITRGSLDPISGALSMQAERPDIPDQVFDRTTMLCQQKF